MKAIILCAGTGEPHFPKGFKPKALHHVRGKILLQGIIETCLEAGLREEDIRVVTGYRTIDIENWVAQEMLKVELVFNPQWATSAIGSIQMGVRGLEEDVLLICGDIIIPNPEVIKFFLICKEQIGCVYTKKPWGEYTHPSYDPHKQICIVKVAYDSFHFINTAEIFAAQWMSRHRKTYAPGAGVVFGAFLNELCWMASKNNELFLSVVDEPIPDVDRYELTDEYHGELPQ